VVKVGSVEGKVAPMLRLKAPTSAAGGSKGPWLLAVKLEAEWQLSLR
jgi:hypothetical protein